MSNLLTHQDSNKSDEPPKELRLGGALPGLKEPGNISIAKLGGDPEKVTKKSKAANQPPREVTEETKRHFRQVFDRIDGELVKLFELEQEKKKLGQDGFMP